MAGVRFKSLQAATPLLDEQFDQILFVVNLAHFPTTFRSHFAAKFSMQILSRPGGYPIR